MRVRVGGLVELKRKGSFVAVDQNDQRPGLKGFPGGLD